ncbi:YggS family pyridoxal phosphate-dependent enzyme [Prochlorococcus sp. MIT 1223]|uniref:YggS family pyridoxal phosphate-dependent enzyme n=1 Tax=Prochlorococcus sp. MIT 1223 TaxID=3096217 RepID=UPI002A75FBE0|nr:YggS family pyridoxal phosphate-dependent enzyme [Prochlorococcus sp. MIT 1223]
MSFADRLNQIKRLLPPKVGLLAVSKGHPDSIIRIFAEHGQFDFGESRLQEALPKIKNLSDINKIRWHFVGHLQSNKVRSVVQHFDVIHSVHSLELAERIARISKEENRFPQIMLQVKFREDPAKVGFSVEDLLVSWKKLSNSPNLEICGLMTITPFDLDLEGRKKLYCECRELANSLKLKDCSMGMSQDWRQAVEAGSTLVRVGSFLFGDRVK